jgi:hypothetical protein
VEGAFLGSLGELEVRSGRLDAATEALDAGEKHLRALDVPLELAKLLCRRALLEQHRGEPDRVQACLDEVISIADLLSLDADAEIRRKVHEIRAKIEES